MIKSVGQMITSSADLAKMREGAKAKAASAVADGANVRSLRGGAATPAARMAAEGAPVDMDRVSALKDAIASGNYPVNPERIAERMIELDMGE